MCTLFHMHVCVHYFSAGKWKTFYFTNKDDKPCEEITKSKRKHYYLFLNFTSFFFVVLYQNT